MIRSILPLFLLLISIHDISAREIQGSILSEVDSSAIIGGHCRLMTQDSVLFETTTDANGRFILSTKEDSPLTLTLSAIDFASTEILLEKSNKDIDLGQIYLPQAHNLTEVTITANTVIESKGRTILYPSTSDIKVSTTSVSLFQKLPLSGLESDPINRTLKIDGKVPTILINGIPSSMADVNALRPENIERIEYSRQTPARYADSGRQGLINILLKKRNDGGDIYLWGHSATTTAFIDGIVSGSYHQGPSKFTIRYTPSWRNYQKVYDNSIRSYIGSDDERVDLTEHDRNPFNYFTNELNLKYTYSPEDNTTFATTFALDEMTRESRSEGYTTDTNLGNYTVSNRNRSKTLTPSLDLFLHHEFNDRSTLEAQIVGTIHYDDYRRRNSYYISGPSEPQYYSMDVDNRRASLISEISYSYVFSSRTSISGGYQNTISRSTNTYLDNNYKPLLTENNNYIYARLSQQIGKVYLSASTGAKLFWIKNDLNNRHFIRNLSSLQISWNINPLWNISASANYSPDIPSLSSLTDYPQQTTPYLISNGNPNLKVAEWFNYWIQPSFSYRKLYLGLSLIMRNVLNKDINDISYIGNGQFLSQTVNARHYRAYAAQLSFRLQDIAHFGISGNLSIARYSNSGEGWEHSLTSLSGFCSLWWSNGPFTISYYRKIPGKYLMGHYVGKEENGDALSVSYKPNDHWTFDLDWNYMFDHKGTKYPSWNYSAVAPSVSERYISNNANMVVISISYSTSFGTIFRKEKRSLNNIDNGSSLLKM